MILIVEILLIVNRYKMENLKTNWKLPKKQKIPAANRKLAAGKLKTFWKQQDLFCFFSKKLPPPLPNSRNRQKSGHKGGQIAPKWLDNTVKPCPKIGWRNRHFSTIQQRKSLWHLFCHRLMVGVTGLKRDSANSPPGWFAPRCCGVGLFEPS